MCSHELSRYKSMHTLGHTVCMCVFHGRLILKHVCQHQMSKVHCGTVLTSNVTNNFFLQSRCSNPFSGFWNGNIITFLWCSAFDKTGLGWTSDWVGCLSKALSSQYFTSLTYSLTLLHLFPFSSHSQLFSLSSPKKVILSLSLPPHTHTGIAVDKRGIVYFVDGTTIQKINERGLLSTVIGSNGLMSTQPLSCDALMDISQVS